MYRKLKAEKIIDTVTVLHDRIYERFPDSGLSKVCKDLIRISQESREKALWFSKPIMVMRVVIAIIVIFSLFVLIYSSSYIKLTSEAFSWGELLQIMEAGINNMLIIFAALFFLFSFETRVKRGRALSALYELRSIAHVIDMHQLTKDPRKVLSKRIVTLSSPKISLNAYELDRYLDYSVEMLSLVGKIAALYGENLKDDIVLSSVNEIENLTTGLSRKIWQKLILLDRSHRDQL